MCCHCKVYKTICKELDITVSTLAGINKMFKAFVTVVTFLEGSKKIRPRLKLIEKVPVKRQEIFAFQQLKVPRVTAWIKPGLMVEDQGRPPLHPHLQIQCRYHSVVTDTVKSNFRHRRKKKIYSVCIWICQLFDTYAWTSGVNQVSLIGRNPRGIMYDLAKQNIPKV